MNVPPIVTALLLALALPPAVAAQKLPDRGKAAKPITEKDCEKIALTKGRRDLQMAILGGGTTTCIDGTKACEVEVKPFFDDKKACNFELPNGKIDVEKSFKGGLLVWVINKAPGDPNTYRFEPKKGVDIVSGNNNKKEDLDDPASGPNDQRYKWTDINKSNGKKSFCYEVVLEYQDAQGKWQDCKRIDPIINNSGN